MSNTFTTKTPLSSTFAIATIIIATFAIACLPVGFNLYPADLRTLAMLAAALLVASYFLLTLIRRRRLYLNLSPLSLPLFLFGSSIFISILLNNFTTMDKSLLSLGGLLLAQITIAIIGSTLIKVRNTKPLINAILIISSLGSVVSIAAFINNYLHFLPDAFTTSFFPPQLGTNLVFLGLATVAANYFKKNKLKGIQLLYLPLLIAGLVTSFILHLQTPASTPTLNESFRITINQLTANQRFHYQTFLLGDQAQDYADVFGHYTQSYHENLEFHQAAGLPLTLQSLFGCISVVMWLLVLARTIWLAFDKNEKNSHLYFILAISMIVQIFTPVYPLILMIQSIIISLATNKNRQTLINLSFATLSDEQIENRDRSHAAFITLSVIGALIIAFASFTLARDYWAYFQLEKALQAVNNQDGDAFITQTNSAVKVAPNLDITNRYAAIGELEQLLHQLATNKDISDTELAHSYQAINYAQKAIKIDSLHASNYLILAQTYQDIYGYSDANGQANLAEQIRAAYAQAALLQPTNPDILLGLGGFYQSVGEVDQAQQFYQQALNLNPNYALSNFQLATLYEQKGNFSLARSTYQNTLELLDKESTDYTSNKELIESKLNQLDQD